MSDQSSVDIQALADFGKHKYLTDAPAVGKSLVGSMGQIGSATVGMVGTNEAQTFAAWYGGMVDALGKFTKDVGLGYESLGGVAIIMASNYRHGDLSQGAAMDDVIDAFNPRKGEKTVADGQKTPKVPVHKKKLPPSTTDKQSRCTDGPQTPLQRWQAHEKIYQDYEKWHPTEPHPKPGPGPTPPPNSKPEPPSTQRPSPSPQTKASPPTPDIATVPTQPHSTGTPSSASRPTPDDGRLTQSRSTPKPCQSPESNASSSPPSATPDTATVPTPQRNSSQRSPGATAHTPYLAQGENG